MINILIVASFPSLLSLHIKFPLEMASSFIHLIIFFRNLIKRWGSGFPSWASSRQATTGPSPLFFCSSAFSADWLGTPRCSDPSA